MRKILALIIPVMVSAMPGFSQGGWTWMNSSSNPIHSFTSPGSYKGAAWIDFDNDGDIDLFCAPKFLFRNDGNYNFTQVSTIIGDTTLQNPSGCSWADYDNDGNIDCMLAQYPSGIYKNNGNGTFTDVTSSCDSLVSYASWGCAFGDMNGDAFLEYTFAHAYAFHPVPRPGRLMLRNSASPSAINLTGYTLTDSLKPFTVPYWSDYDLDGDMDLFVATGPGGSPGYDYCYRNMKMETGLDTLYRMTSEQFAMDLQDGQCYNFIDSDNDGDLDLCLTNYLGAPSHFYQNNNGTYVSISAPFTNPGQHTLSNSWGDFDNDGDQDVITTYDNVPTRYYRNDGSNTFVLVNSTAITGGPGGAGVTSGDFDNDGDLDVFVHGTGTGKRLVRNDTGSVSGNWMNLKLTGVVSNRSAIGAIVRVKAVIGGNPVWQIREVNAQNSFQSQNDLRVHVGLGNATVIDSIVVTWPAGTVQSFAAQPINQFYELTEGGILAAGIKPQPHEKLSLSIYPNPASSQISVSTDGEASWIINDASGRTVLSGKMNQQAQLNIGGLRSGMYFITVTSENKSATGSFIKN